MADKMFRIAGRGADGTAKAIKTDNNGIILVSGEIGKRLQLVTEVSVLANSSVSYEIPLSTVVSATEAYMICKEIELSWNSVDGLGDINTEIVISYHRLTGDLTFSSLTFQKALRINEGVVKGDRSTFFVDSDVVQIVKNNFLTVQFINNTASNKGLYYPTLILKK